MRQPRLDDLMKRKRPSHKQLQQLKVVKADKAKLYKLAGLSESALDRVQEHAWGDKTIKWLSFSFSPRPWHGILGFFQDCCCCFCSKNSLFLLKRPFQGPCACGWIHTWALPHGMWLIAQQTCRLMIRVLVCIRITHICVDWHMCECLKKDLCSQGTHSR